MARSTAALVKPSRWKADPLALTLADPAVPKVSPLDLPVPSKVRATLAGSHRVLIVGHTSSDGDSLGSSLGLARALRVLGKEVTVLADAELPGTLRRLPEPGEIASPADLAAAEDAATFDTVVLVDVAQPSRIGAAAAVLASTPDLNVVVVDHHEFQPTRQSLGLKDDASLSTWIVPEAPSAASLVAGVVYRLLEDVAHPPLSRAMRQEIALPVAVGMLTDSLSFSSRDVRPEDVGLFNAVVETELNGNWRGVRRSVAYALPEGARDLVRQPPHLAARLSRPDAQAIRDGFAALQASHQLPRCHRPTPTTVVHAVPDAAVALAVEAAQLDDPRAVVADVVGELRDIGNEEIRSRDVVVTLQEQAGWVRVSVRSREAGPALALAQSFGGGGHSRAAGARAAGSLAEVERRVDDWLIAHLKT